MIELNLLPEDVKNAKKKFELPDIPIIPITSVVVAILILAQLAVMGLVSSNAKERLRLDKEWERLLPEKAKVDAVKKQIANLTETTDFIDNLIEQRLNWARILNELSDSMTPGVWLTDLSYSEKTEQVAVAAPEAPAGKAKKGAAEKAVTKKIRTLTLSGYALGKGGKATDYIAHFTEALKKNEDFARHFSDIEPGAIKEAKVAEQEVMNFTVVCNFKESI